MALQYSVEIVNAKLDAIETVMTTTALLNIKSGTVPANAAAAEAGTVLASIALSAKRECQARKHQQIHECADGEEDEEGLERHRPTDLHFELTSVFVVGGEVDRAGVVEALPGEVLDGKFGVQRLVRGGSFDAGRGDARDACAGDHEPDAR